MKVSALPVLAAIALACLLSGCGSSGENPNFAWTGLWEDGGTGFGTMSLNLRLSGDSFGEYGDSGGATGRIVLLTEVSRFDAWVSGTWENDFENGEDRFELEIAAADSVITLDFYIDGDTAADLSDDEYVEGNLTIDSIPGHWHTTPDSAGIDAPDVADAYPLGIEGEILDIAYAAPMIYAVALDDGVYGLYSAYSTNGNATAISTPNCAEPRAIAFDGTYFWIVGKALSTDANSRLFKVLRATPGSNEVDYPVESEDLNDVDSLAFYDGVLYYHNGDVLTGIIGSVDQEDGTTSMMLQADLSPASALSRTSKMEAGDGVFYATTLAPGGAWCEIRAIDASDGSLASSVYCPVNSGGPIAADGATLFLVQGGPNRLYAIDLAE